MTTKTKTTATPKTPDYKQLLSDAVTKYGELSKFYSMFYRFSVGNMLLAVSQLEERGLPYNRVATYKQWEELGRQVKKGEKAIWLTMPKTLKIEKENKETGKKEEFQLKKFVMIPRWFSYDQTEGDEIGGAEVQIPEWDKDKALEALNITEETFNHPSQGSQGYAYATEDKQFIAVAPTAEFPHKTRFHEIAHNVLGHTKEHLPVHGALLDRGEDTPRDVREVEAESVAYILLNILNLDGQVQSRGYIKNWMSARGMKDISEKSAQKIFSAVDTILKAGAVTA